MGGKRYRLLFGKNVGKKRKGTRKGEVEPNSLELAFQLVENGMAIREAARKTDIPFSTLQERLKNQNKETPRLGRLTVFSTAQEADMAEQIKLLAKIFYGCTATEIRKMAYEYAVKNNIPHQFNESLGMAGRDWLKGFLKRNKLSSRKAEGTSINRATAFNKQEVTIFFELLESLMDIYKFLPRNIYNVDETGISSVQEPGKIIAEKGQKRVGSITSGERGKNVTAVRAMSATGVFIPPMLIYPRQRHSTTLEVDGSRGAIYKCSKNGWINEDLFVDWLRHFSEFTKPSENEPILLVLNNHSSHISLRAYEFCKSHHIVMLSLPPHGSHRIQPMDVSIYGPFKTAYKQECNLFMKSNLGRQIVQTDIASLFRKAFQKVATIPKAESGFSATGIYPLNSYVFTDEDFMAAEFLNTAEPLVIDEEMRQRNIRTPVPEIGTKPTNISPSTSSTVSESILFDQEETKEFQRKTPVSEPLSLSPAAEVSNQNQDVTKEFITKTPISEPLSSGAGFGNQNLLNSAFQMIDYENATPSTSKQKVTAKDLLPVPKHSSLAKKRLSSRKQHATIITGTPLKEILVEKENKKLAKINKNTIGTKLQKPTRKQKKATKETKKPAHEAKTALKIKKEKKTDSKTGKSEKNEKRRVKRKVLQDKESNTSNSDIEMEDIRDDNDTDIDDDKCLVCNDYGRDNELWYRCVICGQWAHQECTDVDSPRDYKCDLSRKRA